MCMECIIMYTLLQHPMSQIQTLGAITERWKNTIFAQREFTVKDQTLT